MISLLFTAALGACTAQADCIDYRDYLHFAGNVDVPGAWNVEISGTYAYATGPEALYVIDIADPENSEIVGSVVPPQVVWPLAVSGTYAYVAGPGALYVIDVADPHSPQLLSSVATPEVIADLAVAGTHVYAVASDVPSSGLVVIDVADPGSPQVVGTAWVPGNGTGVAVSVTHAFVSCGGYPSPELRVFDITDPQNPQGVGWLTLPGYGAPAGCVTVSGTHAFVGADGDMQVVDIMNPQSPQVVGTLDAYTVDVEIVGTRAYVAGGSGGLYVADLTDLQSPQTLGIAALDQAAEVAISGTYAFVATGSTLSLVDATNPRNAQMLGSLGTSGEDAGGVAVSGRYAHVTSNGYDWSTLRVIDIANPESPQWIGSTLWMSWAHAHGVAVSGIHALVAGGSAGLRVVDVTHPENPQTVGGADTPGYAYGVAAAGTHAYVADYEGGLQVIDLTDPRNPQIVGSADTPGLAHGVAVSGTYACVADDSSGLQVIDIADPQSPQIVGSTATPGPARDVSISGTFAYVACASAGLCAIDITNPLSPQIVAQADTPGSAEGVEVLGALAYVACASTGLCVMDLSNPQNPRVVGGVDTLGSAAAVAAAESCVCIADGSRGLQIAPAQCPVPTPVASVNDLRAWSAESGIALTWHGGFDPDLFDVFVYRRTAEGSWSCLTERPLVETGPSFEYVDGDAEPGVLYEYEVELLAGDGARMRFGPVSCSLSLLCALRLDVRPMLTRGEFSLLVDLPGPTTARICLHDPAGRRLALLEQGTMRAGQNRLELDLRRVVEAQGPTGLYFVRLETPGGWMSRRIVHVR